MPCTNSVHTRLHFCAQILQADYEFLDTPINVLYACDDHAQMEDCNEGTHHVYITICPCKFCTNVTHMRFFSSWPCEFLNREIPAKANLGQFTPRENNSLYFKDAN